MATHGTCDPGFDNVRAVVEDHLRSGADLGVSVALWWQGRPVVDLWGGWADPLRSAQWDEHTITAVWSTSKAVTSLCANLLVDRGELDLDRPVADYWPEFAAAGKSDIPVRWLLSHRSGLSGLVDPVSADDFADWNGIVTRLAAQTPLWSPGTRIGYHPITFGYLVGEVIRRVAGQTVGELVAETMAGPLGLDMTLGLPAEHTSRCATLVPPRLTPDSPLASVVANKHPAAVAAMRNPTLRGDEPNGSVWRAAEIPAVNLYTNARSLAALFNTLIDGSQRLLSTAAMAVAGTGQGAGQDLVTGQPTEFAIGFRVSPPIVGRGPSAIGHDGFGGSCVVIEPEAKLAFAYVPNHMGAYLYDDPRKVRLLDAVRSAVLNAS